MEKKQKSSCHSILCQVTNNIEWKKNRNLHAICILDSVLNNNFESPYNKFPSEGSIPIINKTLVKSKLSKKFFINSNEIMQRKREMEETGNNQPIPENNNENDENENDNEDINNNNNQEQKEVKKKNKSNFVLMNKLKSKFIKIKKKTKPLTEEQRLKLEVLELKKILEKKDDDIIQTKDEIIKLENKRDELQKTLAIFLQSGK